MFKQIEEKYGNDRRIVLMAIKTDGGGAGGAKAYLNGRADLDKWIVAADNGAAYYKAVTGQTGLFKYALVGPKGDIVEVNAAGAQYTNGPDKGKFVPATSRVITQVPDAKPFLPEDKKYPDELTKAVLAVERGNISAGLREASLYSRRSSTRDAAKSLKEDIEAAASARIEAWKKIVEDTSATSAARFAAYQSLDRAASSMRAIEAGKVARAAVLAAKKDDALRHEITAERAYTSLMSKVSRLREKQRNRQLIPALQYLAKKYEGTVYGNAAKAEYDRLSAAAAAE